MKTCSQLLTGLYISMIVFNMSCRSPVKENKLFLHIIPAIVLKKNGAEIFQYWEFKNSPALWDTNFNALPEMKLYKDSLENIFGKARFNLILKSTAFQNELYQPVNTLNGDLFNAQIIHSKKAGRVRPINFLEAQLLEYQFSRCPLLSHPTELHGFILFQEALDLVRVYIAASDMPWPPKPTVILQAIKKDIKVGWTFKSHLHNHYEPRSHQYLGVLAPSMTDAEYYQFLSEDYNLPEFLITNGFHTVEVKKAALHFFKLPYSNKK